jgi:hypothetical protein
MTLLLLKFVPVTVSVNPALPVIALDGEMLVAVGTGLLIVNVSAADSTPPPKTVTDDVPAVAISDAAIDVVNLVELTNVVVRFTPLMRIT